MLKKQFARNVLPAMLAFAFSGIYAIVDGWFVGRNIGDLGLAAINIAYPITAFIQAVGTGIGMGGAIQLGISIGRNDEEEQKIYMGNTVMLLLGACVFTTIALSALYTPLLRLFGAEQELLAYAADYAKYIVAGTVFQLLATGLLPIIRNYDGAIIAMAAMIAGFLTNVFLDWLFVAVWQLGMAGAAVATVIGQAVTTIPCISFLLAKKKLIHFASFRPEGQQIKGILTVAVSPFGLTLSPNIIIIILNKGALNYGGQGAAACYAVISYVVCIVQLLLQGIGDGVQPLISQYYGLKEEHSVKSIRKMAYVFAAAVSVLCMSAMFLLRNAIPPFFGVSQEVGASVAKVLPIFLSGFLFVAFLRITIPYFYAVRKNRFAYLLIYGEPLILTILALLVLPPFIGLQGVWLAVPVTQAFLAICAAFLLKKEAAGN